jgi:hypothetical protein
LLPTFLPFRHRVKVDFGKLKGVFPAKAPNFFGGRCWKFSAEVPKSIGQVLETGPIDGCRTSRTVNFAARMLVDSG